MSPCSHAGVAIDVGGRCKGFHAVMLQDGAFERITSPDPAEIVGWCLERKVDIVPVDASRGWSG